MVEINIFRSSPHAVAVQTGEVLFREGDPGSEMIAVVEGEVDLSRGGRAIETVCAGGIFGELALIDTTPRSTHSDGEDSSAHRARRSTSLHLPGP